MEIFGVASGSWYRTWKYAGDEYAECDHFLPWCWRSDRKRIYETDFAGTVPGDFVHDDQSYRSLEEIYVTL